MEGITLTTRIVLRSDTAASWLLADPVLLPGEPGTETDTGRLKLGDGQAAWSELAYAQSAPAKLGEGAPTEAAGNTPGAIWLDTTGGGVYLNCAEGSAAWKRLVLAPELATLGAGDMQKSLFATGEKAAQGYVDHAALADSLVQPLTTADIAESGPLYFTEARAATAFDSRFTEKAVTELKNGEQVLTATESFVLNGGDAEAM